jgi:hypothetical protein
MQRRRPGTRARQRNEGLTAAAALLAKCSLAAVLVLTIFIALRRPAPQPSSSAQTAQPDDAPLIAQQEKIVVVQPTPQVTLAGPAPVVFTLNKDIACEGIKLPSVLCAVAIGSREQALETLSTNMLTLGRKVWHRLSCFLNVYFL